MNQPCPHCSSTETKWIEKKQKWRCQVCDEPFDAPSPSPISDSPSPSAPTTNSQTLASTVPTPPSHPTADDKAAKPKRIFFSYGHDGNKELVDRFKADLEKRGHTVWIDYDRIGTWDDWKGSITRGIHDSEMAIAFLSIHSVRDPGVCRNEIAMALHHFGTVYPFLLEKVPFENIPVTISNLQWPDLSDWRDIRDGKVPGVDFDRFYEEKLLDIISRLEGEATRFQDETAVLRRVLNPSPFEGRFAQHLEGFVGRDWVFRAFEEWLEQKPESRVFWLKAGPGFGKTALAVNLAHRYRAAIVGTWFCDSQSIELRDPTRALCTIAFQLALRWDDYRTRLLPRLGLFAGSGEAQIKEAIETLAKKNLSDLFSLLISEPLAGLIWREKKLVILLDALDEATEGSANPIAELVSGRFLELPEWISFVVTSRPDPEVVGHLQRFKPFDLSADDSRNTEDLAAYCTQAIGGSTALVSLDDTERKRLCEILVEKSEGMILYLRLIEEGLREGTLAVDQLEHQESGLPGLYSRYHQVFARRFAADYEEKIQPFLRLVLAAPGPLPLDLAVEVLGWSKEQVRKVRSRIGSFLVEDQGGLRFIHKTLSEWLGSEASGEYFTDAEEGKKQLGEFLWGCFEKREKDQNDITKPISWERYVLEWLLLLLESLPQGIKGDAWADLGDLQKDRIKYDPAEKSFLRAIEIWEKALGAEHPDTLGSLNNLGSLLRAKGDYEGAEALYRRALEGREKALGGEHPDTLGSLNNLGSLLRDKGDYEGAEALCRRALEGREKALGGEHPRTLDSLNSLGNLLSDKGDYEGAEALYRRALEGREKTLGEEHPSTLNCVGNLGNLLSYKGDHEGAEALYRRALAGYEKALGAEHPSTLMSVNNLGSLLSDKGDYAGAESLYRRALKGYEKALGADHPSTLNSVGNLGNMLCQKGDYEGAEALLRRALEGYEKALGAEHPSTLNCVGNLGNLLSYKGDYDGAEALYRRALEGIEKALGAEHPSTLGSLNNLGNLLKQKGDYAGAEALYRRALEGIEKALGAEHPSTLGGLNNLGMLLSDKGDYEGAEALYRRALEGYEKALGAEHPSTLMSLNHLAMTLKRLCRTPESVTTLRETFGRSEKSADAVRYNLACYECLTGNTEEAKRLISEHLKLHPEMKDQALADSDFETIRDYIETL